jgi:ribosome-binding factor A
MAMTRRRGDAPSQRQLRVGEMLRHALTQVLLEAHIHDPELAERSITVTEVRLSPDLKNATVYVMPLGGDAAATVLPALRRAAAFLRGQLARQVELRYTPRLQFEIDASFDQAGRIETLLRQPEIARDLEPDEATSEHDEA